MTASASTARTATEGHWSAHRALAWVIAGSVRIGPVVLGLAGGLVIATVLPAPTTTTAVALWWTVVAATPLVVVVVAERALRRLAPLPFLLRLSLTFPGRAPGRLKVLRDTHRTSGLIDQLRDRDPDEIDTPPTAASTLALITALQRHDRFTRGHSERVRLYADLLGEELGLPDADRERLRWAALLHDVGKLRVDGRILNKHGRPDDDEWTQLKRHPELGVRLAGPVVPWLSGWAGAISDHHERFDGTGYPAGTAGDDISLGGRIVAVADAYETMTAGRPYREALDKGGAREELVACAGTQFDPRIVRAFLNLSLPRASWPVALVAWLAELPLLARLRAAPDSAVHGAATAAGVAAMAVSGLISPTPSEPAGSPEPPRAVAQADPEPEIGANERRAPQPSPGAATQPDTSADDRPPPSDARTVEAPGQRPDGSDGGTPDGSDEPTTTRSEREAPREVGDDESIVVTSLYLRAATSPSRRYAVLPMSSRAPSRDRLGNYDTDVDDRPGLRLRPTDRGRSETRLDRRQRWALNRDRIEVAAGPLQLEIWIRPAAVGPQTVQLSAFVDRCPPRLDDCRPVTAGASTVTADPASWQRITVGFDPAGDVTLQEGALVLTVTAGPASTSDVLVAFDTREHPAAISTTNASLALDP